MPETKTQFKKVSQIKNTINLGKTTIKKILGMHHQNGQYVSSYSIPFHITHEGVSGLIEYKGSVVPIINELTDGLRRSMWYLGSKTIAEIQEKSQVVIVTPNTHKDNIPRI